ncbi:MAG: hypothetical protein C4345_14370 [Chloroflexota bacterium]
MFVPADNVFAFTSVYLDRVRFLRIPTDIAGAPQEITGSPGYFSFDRQMQTIAFICQIRVSDPRLPDREVCVFRRDGSTLRRLTRPLRGNESASNHAAEPALSADGSFVVYHRRYVGYLGIVSTEEAEPRMLVQGTDGLTPVVLTQQGVLYKRGGQIWRVRLDGTGARQLTHEREEIGGPLTADAEGHRMAYAVRTAPQTWVLKVVEGEDSLPVLTIEAVGSPRSFWLSGDGRRLLYVGTYQGKDGIYVFDLATKEVFVLSAEAGDDLAHLNETGEIVVIPGKGSPLALAFLPDETPPFVWIDSPQPGGSFVGGPVDVSIRYQDRAVVSGVDPRTVQVWINGADASSRLQKGPDQVTGQLSAEMLQEGENLLEVAVSDRAGNEARHVVRFLFTRGATEEQKTEMETLPLSTGSDQGSSGSQGRLVALHIAGGVAGIQEHLLVFEDSSARLELQQGQRSLCASLDEVRLAALQQALEDAEFPSLQAEYWPAHPVYDGRTYTVAYREHVVRTQDPLAEAPEPLRRVIDQLLAIRVRLVEQDQACW